MLKISHWRTIAALCLSFVISACGGAGSSAPAPSNFKVTPGNGKVTITWQADAGVDYWMMYAATAAGIDIKNPPAGHVWATNVTSPYVVTGLVNGTTYSFAINGRTSGGPGGPQTASQSTAPRAAGTTWIPGTGVVGSTLRGLAYGTSTADNLSYFLAVGDGGAVYKALDGVSQSLAGYVWTPVSTAPSLAYKAAINALSRYIAVTASGAIVSSADLATWTTATSPVSSSLNALATSGSAVVAVGDGGKVLYSTDGLTWAAQTVSPAGFTANLSGVAYSATIGWVAVGQGGSLLTSSDGISWTVQTAMTVPGGYPLNGVTATYGGVFVAVGDNGTVMRSTNGTSWVAQTLASTAHLYAVSTDSVQILAVGAGGVLFSSLDGITWNTIVQTVTASDLLAIVGTSSNYMVTGTSGSRISSIN